MTQDVDARIDKLLSEVDSIRQLNDGNGDDHPDFLAWRKRAEAAVSEKLGGDSEQAKELRELTFFYSPLFFTEGTVITANQHVKSFDLAMNTAVGILKAVRESSHAPRHDRSGGPTINVQAHGGSATADAYATVTVDITTDQLRQLVATAPELSSKEKGDAIAAIPDDEEDLTLEKVDRLLSVATKSSQLLNGILGWLLGNANHIQFNDGR